MRNIRENFSENILILASVKLGERTVSIVGSWLLLSLTLLLLLLLQNTFLLLQETHVNEHAVDEGFKFLCNDLSWNGSKEIFYRNIKTELPIILNFCNLQPHNNVIQLIWYIRDVREVEKERDWRKISSWIALSWFLALGQSLETFFSCQFLWFSIYVLKFMHFWFQF